MNINLPNWNWNQLKSAGRNVASFAAGGVAMAAALHFISAQDAGGLTENINTVVEGVTQIAKGLAGIVAILVPIYTAWQAARSASPKAQIDNVVTNLSSSEIVQAANAVADPGGRNKLINAVAEMPEVRAVVAPNGVAHATDSNKVVSTPAEAAALPMAVPR